MDQPKIKTLLQANHVLGPDGVGSPEGFVKVFPIPATEFCGAVIHTVEGAKLFEDTLDLTELSYIRPGVPWLGNVGT